jgi:dimethylglycine dehydrogenase
MEAGADLGIVNFGMRALLSMRLEKNWADLVPRAAADLRSVRGRARRFIDLNKNNFIGREAAAREKAEGGKLQRVTFVVDAVDADVLGDEPIWHDGAVIGWVTSGGYAHHVDRSLAQGYVPRELATNGAGGFEIEILGERRPARLQHEPLFDPEGDRMRM